MMGKKTKAKSNTPEATEQPTQPVEQKKTINDASIMDYFKQYRASQLDLEKLRSTHIHFCVPCYGGMLTEGFFTSWSKVVQLFTQYGIPYSMSTNVNESLISRGRCHLVAHMMINPKATHLMFIDADIRFDVMDILHMLNHDKGIITGAYPKKSLDWDSIQIAADSGLRAKQLEDTGAQYAINYMYEDYVDENGEKKRRFKEEKGLIELKDGATGFMLIKREVIEKMMEEYPELWFKNDLGFSEEFDKYTYLLFDCMHDQESKRYLSEDYAFCRRWQKLGGKVWLDPLVNLDHMGSYLFRGNTSKMFKRL